MTATRTHLLDIGPRLADTLAAVGPLPPADALEIAAAAELTGRGGAAFPTAVKLRSVATAARAARRARSSSATARRASRPPPRTPSCCAAHRTSCSTACTWWPTRSAPTPSSSRPLRTSCRRCRPASPSVGTRPCSCTPPRTASSPERRPRWSPRSTAANRSPGEAGPDPRTRRGRAPHAGAERGDPGPARAARARPRRGRARHPGHPARDGPWQTGCSTWPTCHSVPRSGRCCPSRRPPPCWWAATTAPGWARRRPSRAAVPRGARRRRREPGRGRAGRAARRSLRAAGDRPGGRLAGRAVGRAVRAVPHGLPRIAAALDVLARPQPAPRALLADVQRWCGLVRDRGACRHPDGSARLVASALGVFADELRLHRKGRCTGTDPRPFLPVPGGARW